MNDNPQALQVIDQKIVLFMDDELTAVRSTDGDIYVSLGHLSDALGLDRQGQTQRIMRQKVLLSGYRQGEIMTAGGAQQTALLRVDLVPFWLAGLNTSRIKDKVRRTKIEQYQQNVAKVLWEAFQEGRLTVDQDFSELLGQADADLITAYQLAQAVVRLARNQILVEARLTGRIDDHEERLEAIETQLQPADRAITETQASQLSQAVKAVAVVLGKKSGRNEFGGVYGELYRRFDITAYKMLPAKRFEEAMTWLNEWYQTLAGREIPF